MQAGVDAKLKVAIEDMRSFFPSAPPGSRAQQSRTKQPRKSKVTALDRGANSKKPRKEILRNKISISHSIYYSCSIVFTVLEESGQAYFSCARIPGFLFFSERDQTYSLACLLGSIQPRTSFRSMFGAESTQSFYPLPLGPVPAA